MHTVNVEFTFETPTMFSDASLYQFILYLQSKIVTVEYLCSMAWGCAEVSDMAFIHGSTAAPVVFTLITFSERVVIITFK